MRVILFRAFRSEYSSKYNIMAEAPLGEGAYGCVYKAVDIKRQIEVVIKIFHDGKTPEGAHRAWNITSRIMHSQIAPTYTIETFTHGGMEYVAVVSRFVPGKSLREVFEWWGGQSVEDQKLIAEDFSKTFVPSLLDALQICHSNNFGHGDFHEGNIMVLLTDIGVNFTLRAILIDFDNASQITQITAATEQEKMERDVRLFKNRIGPYLTSDWIWGSYLTPLYANSYNTIADLKTAYEAVLKFIDAIEKGKVSKLEFAGQIKALIPHSFGGFSPTTLVEIMKAIADAEGCLPVFLEAYREVSGEIKRGSMFDDEASITFVDGRRNHIYGDFFG